MRWYKTHISSASSGANTFCMNENLAHWLTFKTHWENQEKQSGKSHRIGAAIQKCRRPEGGAKHARQTAEKNQQAKKSPTWPYMRQMVTGNVQWVVTVLKSPMTIKLLINSLRFWEKIKTLCLYYKRGWWYRNRILSKCAFVPECWMQYFTRSLVCLEIVTKITRSFFFVLHKRSCICIKSVSFTFFSLSVLM